MLLYTMLYIVLAYLMPFAALTNSVCLNNASFFFLFKYFLCQGYELSGEIALKNNHYYYYYYYNDLNNYRPVSNLCFIAKILEKLVLSQVSSYLISHNLYNTCQSAYRPGHSTETALLKVVNDLFLSLNKGNISVLALLDFSSAFDTIDHTILVLVWSGQPLKVRSWT